MKKILIFGGTSEGRIISETLSKNEICVHVSVATEYGKQLLKKSPFLHIFEGRLDVLAMQELCHCNHYDLLIDATHPFATEVSENIKKCAVEENLPLIRFERNTEKDRNVNLIYVDDEIQCRDLLVKTTGKILLTTGSKNLATFCKNQLLRERLVVRVLPGMESLELCYKNNLEGKQIIAMQGPFSKNMNIAQIEEYGISVLVTKESGKTGGADLKIQAALEKGIQCIVIKNPSGTKNEPCIYAKYTKCDSLNKVYETVEKKLNLSINRQNKINLFLIGVGMGHRKNMTLEAAEKIKNADLIFGAERLISGIETNAKKLPYYLSKDIIPVLNEAVNVAQKIENVCILFSGDSGFFSGANNSKKDLEKLENISIEVLPGISSMSYLASKIGTAYQDAEIISLHGTKEEEWLPKMNEALSKFKKIFLLTSGIKDVQQLGKIISGYNEKAEKKYKMAVGFQLSYENEQIKIINPEECFAFTEEGLYSILLFTE